MADKRRRDRSRSRQQDRDREHRQRRAGSGSGQSRSDADRIKVRGVPGENAFEFDYPPCVEQLAEDLEEVRRMLDAGEVDVAVEELRWLLEGCRSLLEAHRLLGEVAMEESDLPLARGHFGYAYDLGFQAIPEGGLPGPRRR